MHAGAEGLVVIREREAHTFVRLTVSDAAEQCEVDIAIDYRALPPVDTKHGLALDLRELAANKVLALFDRAAPRDFLDLAGLDLGVLDQAMGSVQRFPPDRLHLTQEEYQDLLASVEDWRRRIRDHQRRAD